MNFQDSKKKNKLQNYSIRPQLECVLMKAKKQSMKEMLMRMQEK
jgi:hypothetical protein